MPETTANLETISGFAERRGHDRRTVARRLRAANKQPFRRIGPYQYWRIVDMENVMADHEPKPKIDPGRLLRGASKFLEDVMVGCQNLPACVDSAVADLNLSEEQRDRVTIRLWIAIQQSNVNFILEACPELGNSIDIPALSCIEELAEKWNIDLTNPRSLITHSHEQPTV